MVIFSELFSFSPKHLVLYLFCSTSNMGPGVSGRVFLGSKCIMKDSKATRLGHESCAGSFPRCPILVTSRYWKQGSKGRRRPHRPEPLRISIPPFCRPRAFFVFVLARPCWPRDPMLGRVSGVPGRQGRRRPPEAWKFQFDNEQFFSISEPVPNLTFTGRVRHFSCCCRIKWFGRNFTVPRFWLVHFYSLQRVSKILTKFFILKNQYEKIVLEIFKNCKFCLIFFIRNVFSVNWLHFFGKLFSSKITIDLVFGESTLILSTSKNREKRNGYGIVTIGNNITNK